MNKKMKKNLVLLLSILIMTTMVLAGCGGTDASGSGDQVAKLSMATGGTSGTYYGFCGVISQVMNEKLGDKMSISAESTGASKANIQLVAVGECELAIVQNDVMSYAYEGSDMFNGEAKIQNFSAIAACYPETCQIISSQKIESVEDLRGKNISVGDSGSGVEFNAKQILGAYGITFDDINVSNQSFADSADSLKNGSIDAAFITAGAPTTAVTELSANYSFNLLAIDDEHAEILMNDYGFYTKTTIPAGTYKSVEGDVQTVSVLATLIASNDVSEDVIYEFTKGLFEYKDEITKGHSKGELLSTDTAVLGISIPFHPGAEKYYKEVGALK